MQRVPTSSTVGWVHLVGEGCQLICRGAPYFFKYGKAGEQRRATPKLRGCPVPTGRATCMQKVQKKYNVSIVLLILGHGHQNLTMSHHITMMRVFNFHLCCVMGTCNRDQATPEFLSRLLDRKYTKYGILFS